MVPGDEMEPLALWQYESLIELLKLRLAQAGQPEAKRARWSAKLADAERALEDLQRAAHGELPLRPDLELAR